MNLARINQTGKGDSKVIDELNIQVSRDSCYRGTNRKSWSSYIRERRFLFHLAVSIHVSMMPCFSFKVVVSR